MITGHRMDELYPRVVEYILTHGHESAPRGLKTKEVLAQQVMLIDARNNILANPVRAINHRFMLAEWLWIIAGRDDLATLTRYNKEMAKFSDDGQKLTGAYGPRLQPQWEYVIENLQRRDTRQAVMTIWTPSPKGSKDIPCTISLQFLIRGGLLHTIATMRSSDVWLGLPYDMFTFAMIGNMMAGITKSRTGALIMQLGSLHVYEPHYQLAGRIKEGANVELVRSPQLTARPPADNILDLALGNSVVPTLDLLWDSYADALMKPTKAEALEVLRGIASEHP